jgi:hypothetical protein
LYTTRELESLGQARAASLFRSNSQAKKMAEMHDRTHQTIADRFTPGQFVKRIRKRLPNQMIPKLAPRWEGPFIIESAGPHDSYILKKPNGQLEPHPVNANHLAPFISSQSLNQLQVIPGKSSALVLYKHLSLPCGIPCVLIASRKGVKGGVLSGSDFL